MAKATEPMELNSQRLLDFVRGLQDRDENDPVIESFMVNGIPQVELEDCALMLEILIQIYMGTLRINYKNAVKPKKANPFKLIKGALLDKGRVVSSNVQPVLELVL